MPNFILPRFKPKIIDYIINDNINIGKIVGVNLKTFDIMNLKHWDLFVEGILKLKSDEDTRIYVEDTNKLPPEFLKTIEESTGLIFSSGDNIRMQNIPDLIKNIYKYKSKDCNTVDTLIISANKEKIIDVIKLLIARINFFTVIGLEDSLKDEVYNEVFEYTGVSIFQPKNIDKIIKNYGTIINFNEEVNIEKRNIRNECVIIDFSKTKPLKSLIDTNKNVFYVEDIYFKSNLQNKMIDTYVNSDLYVSLGNSEGTFDKIYVNGDLYTLSSYIKNVTRIRGRI